MGSSDPAFTASPEVPKSAVPSISLPKGGGAVRGIGEKFSTNSATGTASLSIPIATSAGRSEFGLSLELSYDSGSGNGPFGIGWHLSTPAITRRTDKGLPQYLDAEESDTFILSGAEDLVPVRVPGGAGTRPDAFDRTVDGRTYRVQRYRPRIEGLFARLERWTAKDTGDIHWRATTKDNVTNIYGKTTQARIADPDDACRVFSWLLEETRDDRGNIARYTYKAEDEAGVSQGNVSEANRFLTHPDGTIRFAATAQRYLKRIEYGNTKPGEDGNWLFEVVFDYGDHDFQWPTPNETQVWPVRQDPFSSYRAGFDIRTYRLCRRVLMFHCFAELGPTPCLVRSTDFTYDEGPVVTYLAEARQAGCKRDPNTGAYQRAEFPALELGYIRPKLHDEVRTIDRESLQGICGGIGTGTAQWVDLDGEGIPGVLTTTERAWFYKANRGGGRLAAPTLLHALPASAELAGGVQLLTDLAGDGQLDLVEYAPPLQGFFTRTQEGDWQPFTTFRHLPNIDWDDPNLRFLDLNGDGYPDVLISEDEVFTWYRSLAKEGFDSGAIIRKPQNEREGPALAFADGTETVFLADMSGDGLVDIARIRNGETSYWPNLGFGRFGRKVTLATSPWFDAPGQFDPKRLRLADIDGSGTTDILYLSRDGVSVYFNQSGNALSQRSLIASLPVADNLSSVDAVDLLGGGTACLVWSSPAPASAHRPVAYIDMMGGRKPHLLESIVNNLGAETRIAYAASTRFYLDDKVAGRPWFTRLPFPVHVIERIERCDHIARSKLVTRFAYHHGYFDGHEREFRGFARVEQWDAESFSGEKGKGLFPDLPYDVDPANKDLNLPPVRTVTWFHTGAWLERDRLERALAEEYYDQDPLAPLLPDTALPPGLSIAEAREAARALRGQILRQEIYAEDETPEAAHPYTVSERDYEVRLLQNAHEKAHAVFFVHSRHTINLHYERRPDDPRIQHEVVLVSDEFGNVTRSAAVAYPRRIPQEPEQARLWATVTERTFANRPNEADWYRIGVPVETVTSELAGVVAPAQGVLSVADIEARFAAATEIPYESGPTFGLQRRVVERDRRLYCRNSLSGPLPLGQIESLALAYETYRQVFTSTSITDAYGGRVTPAILQGEGRYVQQDGHWWVPSGRALFDPACFYLPVEAIDPFGQRHLVRYDDYSLLVLDVEDPLHNRVTAGLRDAGGNIISNGNDYSVLAPILLTDPNRNRTAIELDALGMVVKTAVMGKDGAGEGDTLADPTIRIEYDLHRWKNHQKPGFVHTLAREQHGLANPRWQETYSYSDGSGREVLKKVQAEPGPVPILDGDCHILRNSDGSPLTRQENDRWVGTGRTVFDNKANAVKKYEPFFSGTFEYEDEKELVEWGVTPVLRYDPLSRLVRTDQPNGTHARMQFDAWKQETWDENDTAAGTPWLARKQAGTAAERRCATLTLAHAGTPTIAHLDSLGRIFLTVAENGPAGTRPTRVQLDIEGNQLSVTDARGNMILRQAFDMFGRPVRVVRADAGSWDAANQRRAVPVAADPDGARTLLDVADKPIRLWDERGQAVVRLHDELQRPTHLFVTKGADPEKLVERTVYGETHPQAENCNLRSRAFQSFDGVGVLTNVRFDFKGNLKESIRRLAKEYHDSPDWSPLRGLTSTAAVETATEPLLELEPFTIAASYDALNRVTSRTTPDASETRPSYNQANLLEMVEVRIRGEATWTKFVTDIDYSERGQRILIKYGNGTETAYKYDEETFRLIRQITTGAPDNRTLQDLTYEYDPVGNITQIIDRVSFGRPAHAPNVADDADYHQRLAAVYGDRVFSYDPIYQLVEARGRHRSGQQADANDAELASFVHPNDPQGLVPYRQAFTYDPAGNITQMSCHPLGGAGSGWTRPYRYAPDSNRLLATGVPGDPPGTLFAAYAHDAAGNMTQLPHLPGMHWDNANRLQHVEKQVQHVQGQANNVYFAYDSGGQRVRKVYEHSGSVEERIYLGGYEVYRKRSRSTAQPDLERQTLHVVDGEHGVAMIETKTRDDGADVVPPERRVRYQLEDHLLSSVMELDDKGEPFSYEEYYPYGETSNRAASAAFGGSAKRYRYNGKERDEETSLYYYGARYYAAWLGRWTSCDPEGVRFGTCLFEYGHNNPIGFVDPTGKAPETRVETAREMIGTPYRQEQESALRTASTSEALQYMDCSEFVSRVLAADNITDGVLHLNTTGIKELLDDESRFTHDTANPAIGDIAVWKGHVGIVTGVEGERIKLTHARGSEKLAAENAYAIPPEQYRDAEFYGYYRPKSESPQSGGAAANAVVPDAVPPVSNQAEHAPTAPSVSKPASQGTNTCVGPEWSSTGAAQSYAHIVLGIPNANVVQFQIKALDGARLANVSEDYAKVPARFDSFRSGGDAPMRLIASGGSLAEQWRLYEVRTRVALFGRSSDLRICYDNAN